MTTQPQPSIHKTLSNRRTHARPPTETVFVRNVSDQVNDGPPPPPPEDKFRAVHRIRRRALEWNYECVERAANQQKCSVICVVKADGYGHGAIATALHLADACGADAFAVATLEEAIALRKALEHRPPRKWSQLGTDSVSQQPSHANFPVQQSYSYHGGSAYGTQEVHVDSTASSTVTGISALSKGSNTTNSSSNDTNGPPTSSATHVNRMARPSQIRIVVLGPPVNYPRCFDDYFHYGIEVMVSGPEVAAALLEWVVNEKDRKRIQVERAAMEAKERALLQQHCYERHLYVEEKKDNTEPKHTIEPNMQPSLNPTYLKMNSSTLGNVSGPNLAKEVRAILLHQRKIADAAMAESGTSPTKQIKAIRSSGSLSSSDSSDAEDNTPPRPSSRPLSQAVPQRRPGTTNLFGGIEVAARASRQKQAQQEFSRVVGVKRDAALNPSGSPCVPAHRRRLRWHALVDSGMGRLGFKTEIVPKDDTSGRRDTVDILREMIEAEVLQNGPIEFYGMCTHMADASSTSDYTSAQISRFVGLLNRVRAAGITVPTVSTDNSAALLTTNLRHFDPSVILSQPGYNTRGNVRTGGAIFGQRPAFKQLKAVSTLVASVRHVAILRKGDSVGYDRAYIAPHAVRIATLTIGFADGYPRELGNGVGRVQIRGAVFPVAGNVCMDMLMVELGPADDMAGPGSSVNVGDTAVLWGPADDEDDEGLVRLQDIASTLKTTQSALTCGLSARVPRQYV